MPEEKDTNLGDYQLLPVDDPAIDAAAELEGAFVDPEGDPAIDAEFAPPPPMPLGRSWAFDIAAGRMIRYGQRPVETHGTDTLKQWIDIVLNVDAGAHSIFPDDFGMDDPWEMIGQQYSPALESEFQQKVQNALLVHDRIESVGSFIFQHDENDTILYVEFVVVTDTGAELKVVPPFEVPTVG